jgi:hypothetical protein
MSGGFSMSKFSTDANEPVLVPIPEVQRLSGGESRASVYRALAAGELDAVKRGRRTLVMRDSVIRRLNSLPKATYPTKNAAPTATSKETSETGGSFELARHAAPSEGVKR